MKTFNYKKYTDCYFMVSSYLHNKNNIAIQMFNGEHEPVTCCTVNIQDCINPPHTAIIKNYSENSYMTKFLESLGIVKKILFREPCNEFVLETLKTDNPQTIDVCEIDYTILKEYSRKWLYSNV